jgi:hypothetical protein
MPKTSGHRPGGGIASRVNKQVGNRLGQSARGKTPGHVASMGQMKGNHVMEDGRVKGDPLIPRFTNAPWNAGQQLGNANAAELANGKAGPGKGRVVYACGTQGMTGRPDPGNAPAKNHDILRDYGPDFKR